MPRCLILLFGILFLAGCSDNSGFLASWEYDLGVENLTSHEYLSATMIQLNNVTWTTPHKVITTITPIGKDSMERLRINAEDDEDGTLFAVFVMPCKEDGAPLGYPSKSYFLSAFPYKMFRDPSGIKKIQIRDEDLNEVSISEFPSFAQPEFTGVE
jgi:hypothetical protein